MSFFQIRLLKSAFYIFIVNILVLLALLLIIEIGLRVAYGINDCFARNDCSYTRIKKLKIRDLPPVSHFSDIGLTKYDENLGFALQENFNKIIASDGWKNKRVSINQNGFRDNDNIGLKFENRSDVGRILVVGDSFAFGSQVSNNETWPACLERISGVRVDNGGVFAYGAAQSLKRGMVELEKGNYQILLLSILIPENFDRDRYLYWQGYPRVPLIKLADDINWEVKASEQFKPGTKYKPEKPNIYLRVLYSNSLLFAGLFDRAYKNYNFSGNALYVLSKSAPTSFEIMESIFDKLSKLNIDKYVVLQYQENISIDPEITVYREKIQDLSKKYNIKVIDSFDTLRNEDVKKVWFGHYTPYGNEVVCKYIRSQMQFKNK